MTPRKPLSPRWAAIAALVVLAVVQLANVACASTRPQAPSPAAAAPAPPAHQAIAVDTPAIVIDRQAPRHDGDTWQLVIVVPPNRLLVVEVDGDTWAQDPPGTPVTLSPGSRPGTITIRRGAPPPPPPKQKSTAAAAVPPVGSEGEQS